MGRSGQPLTYKPVLSVSSCPHNNPFDAIPLSIEYRPSSQKSTPQDSRALNNNTENASKKDHSLRKTNLMLPKLAGIVQWIRNVTSETDVTLPSGSVQREIAEENKTAELINTGGNVPRYLEIPFRFALQRIIEDAIAYESSTQLSLKLESASTDPESIQKSIDEWAHLFKTYTSRFKQKEEDIFPKAYSTIVNSNISLLETLIQLEAGYVQAIEEFLRSKQDELQELTSANANNDGPLLSPFGSRSRIPSSEQLQLLAETELQTAKELADIKRRQKEEYREFVIKIYEEIAARKDAAAEITDTVDKAVNHLSRSPSTELLKFHSTGSLGPKSESLSNLEEIDEKIETNEGRHNPSEPRTKSSRQPTDAPTISSTSPPLNDKPKDPDMRKKITELIEMGFPEDDAEAALEIAELNSERAIGLLLENPQLVKSHHRSKQVAELGSLDNATPRHPLRKSGSLLSLSRDRAKSNTPKGESQMSPPSTSNQPNPFGGLMTANKRSFSFTKSLFAASKSEPNALSGTLFSSQQKTNNPFNKVGSFFGRALDALKVDIDTDTNENMHEDLSDTFTIHLGTQVRSMYNLRLQVSDMNHLFYRAMDAAQELATRIETSSKLYSNRLSATIVLLKKEDFADYVIFEKRRDIALLKRCRVATEFHFDSFEEQIAEITKQLPKDDEGRVLLNEGDFFVTKHSNLFSVHLVFHLVWSEIDELRGASGLISGYRSLLHIAHSCNVSHLTIPIMLLPDSILSKSASTYTKPPSSSGGNISQSLFLKRAEAVLKHTKGVATEQSRMQKQAGGGTSGMEKYDRSFVFTIPKTIPNVVTVFDGIREKLTEIFRTS